MNNSNSMQTPIIMSGSLVYYALKKNGKHIKEKINKSTFATLKLSTSMQKKPPHNRIKIV